MGQLVYFNLEHEDNNAVDRKFQRCRRILCQKMYLHNEHGHVYGISCKNVNLLVIAYVNANRAINISLWDI